MSQEIDILIVEENAAEAEHLKHILEQHEYRAAVEHDAKSALASMRQNKPQIVISAVLFAEMDGYALCREIKSAAALKNISVILLTSLSDATDIIRGMECGADNFITKPYDEELLISRIKFILLNRELRGGAESQIGVEVIFHDEKYSITPERQQMVDLLLSTYETAVQKNIELTRVQTELNRLNDTLEEQCAERTAQLTAEIIERQAAEASLKESEERYRSIVEIAQEGIWLIDEQTKTSYVNNRMAELLGFTADEMLGRSMFDFMDDAARIEAERNFQKRREGIKERHDFRFRRKDNTDLWAIVSSSPMLSESGVFTGAVGMITDITDRKLAENALAKETAYVELLQVIAVAANQTNDIEEAAQICLDKVCEMTKWHLGHLNLLAKSPSEKLEPTTLWSDCDRALFETFIRNTENTQWGEGIGLPGRVLETEKPVWITDISESQYFIRKQAAIKVGIKSAFAFPILTQGTVRGVLEFFSTVAAEPDEKLLEVMTSIGTQLGQVIERRRAETSLQTSEDRYRHLVENSRDLICTHDLEGNILALNQTAVKALGYDLNTLLNQNVQSVLAPEFQNGFDEYIAKLKKEGVAGGLMTVKSASGEKRVWEYNNTLRTEGVDIPIVRGMAVDVTERSRAEKELGAKEEQLVQAQRIARIGSWTFDLTDKTVAWSDEMFRIMGYELNEIVPTYETYLNLIHPDDLDFVVKDHKKMMRERSGFSHEHRLTFADGTLHYVAAKAQATVNEKGKVIKITGTAQDITERRLANDLQRASEAKFRSISETANDGIVVAESRGIITSWNKGAQKIFGYSEDEILNQPLTVLMPEVYRQAHSKAMERLEAGEEAHLLGMTLELHGLRKNGDEFPLELSLATWENGGETFYSGIIRDTTERKQIEEMRLRRIREATLRAEVSTAIASKDSLPKVLGQCAEALVKNLDAAFARIWILDAAEKTLELRASAGLYTHLDGAHSRIPIGKFKIGKIARNKRPHLTNDIPNDTQISEREWARSEGITAFAGYPLILENRVIGVVGMFSRAPFFDDTIEGIETFADTLAQGIERKRAEQEVVRSERRYRQLGEGIMHQVWTAQPDGKLDYVNGVTLEYFGRAMKQMLGEGWQNVIHPADLPMCVERWTESLETGNYYEVEFRLKNADGTYRWHLGRATAGTDTDGKIVKWFGTNTDVHDKKLAEDALKVARLQLETALDAGEIATWNYDILNNRIIADKKMAQLFSVSPEDAAGGSVESYLRAIHPDDRLSVEENLAQDIAGETNYEMDYRVVKSDNTIRWVESRGHIERDTTGTATRMAGVVIDITERKKAEQSLLESEERLQQSQKMEAIGTLTGGVAHDFNNLLTAILGNTQLAQRKLAHDDPIRLRLTEVADAGNRAAELTRKLLAFSRRQHLEKRAVDLNDTIAEIVKLLERIIGEDVEVSVKYADDLQTVFADPGQIEQVVMNLAVNARDAMPEGGKVTIETSNVELDESYCRRYPYVVPGRYVQIRVSDTGSGIDEETQARIFEPFFTTKEVGKGTGLGLSMAYGIVKQHDGHINLYSELGFGTTFKVYLPTDEKTVEEKAQTIPISFLGGSETILVAEDEEPLRNLAKDTLEDLGYTVLLAKDGAEAVEIFNANRGRINLFLTDVVMPRMGGSEAYERIRESGENIPLIFVTGYSAETVQSRFVKPKTTAEELGAAVIQKPYTLEELGRIVREVLDKSQKK